MEVQEIDPEEWKKISRETHAYAFKEIREEDVETIDFALMAVKDGCPMAYCTCIVFDKYSVYMQHGGALPDARGTINVAKGYAKMISHLKSKYPRITTKVRNNNISMLKLALSVGFLVDGIYMHKDGDVHLHMTNERDAI